MQFVNIQAHEHRQGLGQLHPVIKEWVVQPYLLLSLVDLSHGVKAEVGHSSSRHQ